jgi:heme-degrading monooxygenase HmoA
MWSRMTARWRCFVPARRCSSSSTCSKAPKPEDHTLYASHTVWVNRAAFEAWTQSEAFRAAHHRAGDNKPLYLGHPQFEGFEVRQTVGIGKAQVA